MTRILWAEPQLPAVSGGLRYNQQLRSALTAAGAQVEVLALPEEVFAQPTGTQALTEARAKMATDLVVIDGLIGSANLQLFTTPTPDDDDAATVLLVHLPAAAALAAQGEMDPEVVRLEKWAVLEADHVVTASHWAAGELRRRYRRQDIEVAQPGVEQPQDLLTPAGSESADGVLTLAAVAALNPLKNHLLLGQALQPLMDMPHWQLVLAGPGAETEYGQEVLAILNRQLPDRVEYLGVLSPLEVSQLWSRTDLLLLPSLVETYGMVVAEACAHGVPALVASGTGAEEAAGGAGLIADTGHPETWTQQLRAFLTDADHRRDLGARAMQRRSQLPTWGQAADQFLNLR
ncbi:glycosyltransferase family 4 protein [Nesterenkonia sp. MY13]|uniref:Glycosyltransferase family 4 protein n=1 Tax=Nesterenkonia sedimenti TaxID=1463632 RepID=A0A7X8TLA2_9MICC|nr:glycosyltransferase family 4 protein [Nesterenkonia sedimenti]NLS10634.1 glycosyltransferase family 4 protein [Nesterenkonia sedimenti]